MPSVTATSGFATTLSIGDGQSSEAFTDVCVAKNITGPTITLDSVETTPDISSPWKSFMPTLLSAGEVGFELEFSPSDDSQTAFRKAQIQRRVANFKLTIPTNPETVWQFAGFITSFETGMPRDGVITGSASIMLTGEPDLGLNPDVDAGDDADVQLPATASLSVTDDADGTPTYQWSKVSGPGTITFSAATAATGTATFSVAGTYIIKCVVTDGNLHGFDTVTYTVLAA